MMGVYALVLRLEKTKRIGIGKMGEFLFPAGHYVYTGSAMNSLAKRVERHLKKEKKMRWNIDFLLEKAEILAAKKIETKRRVECALNKKIFSLDGAELVCRKFGSHDCGCKSHLAFFRGNPLKKPSFNRLFK